MTQGLALIRKLGRFVEFSVFGKETSADWSIIGDRKELDVRGAHLGPYCYPIAIDLLERGLMTSKGIVTHRFALDQYGTRRSTSPIRPTRSRSCFSRLAPNRARAETWPRQAATGAPRPR